MISLPHKVIRNWFIALVLMCHLVSFGTNRALLVGIANYPSQSGWEKLNSLNDVELLKPALETRGFEVTSLIDAQATHDGIVKAIKSLTRQCQPGDQVILHFSAHGQQVEDLDGDETDGLDEAIIPYDAKRRYSKQYYGQNHLIDDELNIYLITLRKRLGPKGFLLMTVDACHSGDTYRDSGNDILTDSLIGTRRGANDVFCKKPPFVQRRKNNGLHFEKKTKKQGYSPIIVVGACQPEQCNYETVVYANKKRVSYGTLTYMMWHGLKRKIQLDLREFGHWLVTYKSLYMNRYQQPHLFEEE